MKSIKLFPHILGRIAGLSFEEMERLNSIKLHHQSQVLGNLYLTKEKLKLALSDALFKHISILENAREQNQLQNLRRDIFNDRKVKLSKMDQVLHLLPSFIKDQLHNYFKVIEDFKQAEIEAESLYKEELSNIRIIFGESIKQEELHKGLILSSQSLLTALKGYQKRTPDNLRNKEHKTEFATLKYLSRIVAKTSPFSTFTNLAHFQTDDVGHQFMKVPGDGKIKGHIRLNNYLLKYLKILLISNREVYLNLPLRPNPTISIKENEMLFITNNDNIEAFQRLPTNPAIILIWELSKNRQEGILFQELVSEAVSHIEASEEELENYIKDLIDYGLFEYSIGVSGIDPNWDITLIKRLQELKLDQIPYIQELIHTLIYKRQLLKKYALASSQERKDLLKDGFEAFRSISMKLHKKAGLPEEERLPIEEFNRVMEERNEKEIENNSTSKEAIESKEKENVVFKHQSSTFFSFKAE
ncbi:lantibiotic dehydratase, partial [Xanthovirga aplysinae]|uniref:lantibiotic dehydratase n=1 Tax=Xanthovirga aplysinae TaxID=2529853 RepID=UPI0012BCEF9B